MMNLCMMNMMKLILFRLVILQIYLKKAVFNTKTEETEKE